MNPTPVYYLYMRGAGAGCDFTIGCNQTLRKLNATNMDEVMREVPGIIQEYTDPEIDEAVVLQFVSEFDCDRFYRLTEHAEAAEAIQKAQATELAEYERLRKKYG